MQKNNGELLPRVEPLPETRELGYYIAENATVTIYQSSQLRLGWYTIFSFVLGGVLSAMMFIWNNDAHSANLALALLRSEPVHKFTPSLVNPGKTESIKQLVHPPAKKVQSNTGQLPVKLNTELASKTKLNTLSIKSHQQLPKLAEYSVRHAILLAEGKTFEQAENLLLGEYQRGNASQQLLSALGALYSKHRHWKKAALSYSRACIAYTPSASCFYNLAVSYDHLKEHNRAINAYQKALQYFIVDEHKVETIAIQRRIAELQQW